MNSRQAGICCETSDFRHKIKMSDIKNEALEKLK